MENKHKKELDDLKDRELELEAIVHAMYEVFEKSSTLGGGIFGSLLIQTGISKLMMELYNKAEVSVDITDLVQIEVSYGE